MFQKVLKTKLAPKAGSKKGFTLAELLIVVAIIAVLVAIAVPIFAAQLNKAKDRTVSSNIRSAISLATTNYLVEEKTGEVTYGFTIDDQKNLILHTPATAGDAYTVTVKDGQATGLKHPAFLTGNPPGNTDAVEPPK